MGLATITFGQNMILQNHTYIDSKVLEIELIPHNDDAEYNLTNVAFTWICTSFNHTEL